MNARLLLMFFLCTPIAHIFCKQPLPSAIFALEPLTIARCNQTWLQTYTPYLQSAALPISACFFYAINKNDLHADLTKNPYTTALLLYIALQYSLYTVQEYQQRSINAAMQETLQQLFYLLVVGHGIRNSILHICEIDKKSASSSSSHLEKLELFLNKTHDLWVSLFLKYNAQAKHQSILTYHTDEIDLFEILQASSHDHELMNLIADSYQENSYAFNHQAVLQHLEKKLMLLNDQFMQIKMRIG